MIDTIFQGITLNKNLSFFIVIISYLFILNLSYFLYSTLSQYYFDYVIRSRLQAMLTRSFMEKAVDLDFVHLENPDVRNLMARVQETSLWRIPEILQRLNYLSYSLVSLVLTFFIALRFNLLYFFLLAILLVPFILLRARYSNAAYSIYSLNSSSTNLLWYLRGLFTTFSAVTEIKLYGLKDYFISLTNTTQRRLIKEYTQPILKFTAFSFLEYIATPILLYFALNSVIQTVIKGNQTIGDFTLFVSIITAFGGDLAGIFNNINSIYENNFYAADFFKLLRMKNNIVSSRHAKILTPATSHTITFDHVSFGYPNAIRNALTDISFEIKKKQDVAIVGHNGAGKTTLIKLLLRFYDPTEGRILIDGIDLREIDLQSWYKEIGILFQDFARYDVTLNENVLFGNIKEMPPDEVDRALKEAQAEDIVRELTKGKDQRLGRWLEDSEELSTGQWQKVAIARALYRNAPILILDEPTSNIDAEAEYAIFENLKKIYKNKTLIFISHRFSTVRMADRIFVLDKGKLVEQGTHEELLKYKGLYAKYFSLQKKGYE